jgi:hypothetical protein
MRILWVRRKPSDEGGGDSLYDGKLIRGLKAAGHDVVDYGLARNSRPQQFLRAALNFSLPEQYAVGGPADKARVRELLQHGAFGAVIFSHEHIDAFARAVRGASRVPFVALRHNITSDLMRSVLEGAPVLSGLYCALAESQERAALAGALYQAVAAISVRDRRLLAALTGRQDLGLVQPGAPPAAALNDDAAPARDLVISGTFDWYPKARDLKRFVGEYAAAPPNDVRLRCTAAVPADLRAVLGANDDDAIDAASAIRFGLISDRFDAGHKLKTAAYLMNNCAVISFAKVKEDFADLPFASNWIAEVESMAELTATIDTLTARPPAILRAELTALKEAIAMRFDWNKQAGRVAEIVEKVVRSPAL